jgi:hypothetical protein
MTETTSRRERALEEVTRAFGATLFGPLMFRAAIGRFGVDWQLLAYSIAGTWLWLWTLAQISGVVVG